MDGKKDKGKRVFHFLQSINILPKTISEADLFVFGFSFILLLLLVNNNLALDLLDAAIWDVASESQKRGGIFFGIILLIIGAPFAIHLAFSRRKVGKFRRYFIRVFYVTFNIVLAIAIGIHAYENPIFSNKLIAVWQFLHAGALFLFTGKNYIGEYVELPKKHARRNEIILALLTVLIFCTLGFFNNWYWAVTFSWILFVWGLLNNGRNYQIVENMFLKSPILGKRKLPNKT